MRLAPADSISLVAWLKHRANQTHARNVATRPIKTGHKARRNGISSADKNDWNGGRRRHGGARRRRSARGRNRRDPMLNQVSDGRRQPVILALCPTVFDRQVLTVHISSFLQPLLEPRGQRRGKCGRGAMNESNRCCWGLLCVRGERPSRRSADKGDELALTRSPRRREQVVSLGCEAQGP